MKRPGQWKASIFVALIPFAGCGGLGQVNQGRVVEYQKAKGLITLIQDSNYRDPAHPRFDVLPPVTVRTPEDPHEMGPEPEAGKLLLLDCEQRRAVIFDSTTQSLQSVAIMPVAEHGGVRPSDPRVSKARFPIVDRANRTITVYLPRDRKLVVFTVAGQYGGLPDDTWKIGDEVRYYYKDPGRALRLMNVSKTDLNKAGK